MAPIEKFSSQEDWEIAIAHTIRDQLTESVKTNGQASFLVSGGSSPLPIYRRLSDMDLPWDKISIALVDERWVGPNHDASNERKIRSSLLINKAANAKFVGMKTDHDNPFDGLETKEQEFATLAWPFDLVLLGMGSDGHTASFFPNSQGLEEALDTQKRVCAIKAIKSDVTGEHVLRMTISLQAIRLAKKAILAISGDTKLKVWEKAQTCMMREADMPVKPVLGLDNCTTYWWG